MKKALRYLVLLPFLGAVACGGPKVIPDSKLSDILLDMYLVNAYTGSAPATRYDSINIYEPILNDYGYTTRDFTYTLANFTKRRSAKLAPIVDVANDKLDAMLADLNIRIEKENRIDSLAWALTMKQVYADSLIEVRRMADTARLRIRLAAEKTGTYRITYNHLQDTSDKNNNLMNRHSLLDAEGNLLDNNSQRVVRGRESKNYETKLTANEKTEWLELWFGGYRETHKERPRFTVDSLSVVWLPPREEARREYARLFIDERIFIDGIELSALKYEAYRRDTADTVTIPAEAIFDENGTEDSEPLPVR